MVIGQDLMRPFDCFFGGGVFGNVLAGPEAHDHIFPFTKQGFRLGDTQGPNQVHPHGVEQGGITLGVLVLHLDAFMEHFPGEVMVVFLPLGERLVPQELQAIAERRHAEIRIIGIGQHRSSLL